MNEMRQRWRLTVRRGPEARDMAHRDVVAGWEAALRASGLPVAETQAARPRPRILFAAPIPVGMLGERELIDLGLTECRLAHDVRESVGLVTPVGYRLVDLYDVWSGGPTLPSLVVAGDYRAIGTAGPAPPGGTETIDDAVADLLAAPRIEAHRDRGDGTVTADIRPLVLGLRGTAAEDDGSIRLDMRLRLGGTGAVGRPEEVIRVLAERLGRSLHVSELVRERIHLADDPPQP